VAEEILVEYAWPGNVREMENVINRAYILADGNRITLADLPPDIARHVPAGTTAITTLAQGNLRDQLRRIEAEIILRTLGDCEGDRRAAAQRLEIGLSSLYRKLEELSLLGGTNP
jgi:DNA-binding NtrC family response regulator